MATQTANGKFHYNHIYFNRTLNEWVQLAHKNNCDINNWPHYPLRRGAFGYDNLAIAIAFIFTKLRSHFNKSAKLGNNEINLMASTLHDGWVENYKYWRDNRPWETNNKYFKPNQDLGDPRRETCANATYDELSDEEKMKDIAIVMFILHHYSK
jgi:hypothetical protein